MRAAKVTVKVSEDPVQDVSPAETTIATRSDRFARFSARSSHYLGSRWAFIGAIGVILVWALTGPIFHYSDTIRKVTIVVPVLMINCQVSE